MTVLASDLIAETRSHLLGGIRESKNKLTTTMNTSVTSMVATYDMGPIQAGAVVSIGLERMYVWSVSSSTATVERAWDGTAAAAHTAGDIITVNSRFDDFTILRALNRELDDLSSPSNGLFRPRSISLTYSAATFGYDLTSVGTVIGSPLAVLTEGTGTGEWTNLPANQFVYNASADTADFASGRSLTLLAGGSSGLKVRFVYRAPFVNLAALTDDVQAVSFLPATANDIPPLGAALRLAASRPMRRSDQAAQGSTRRAEEVATQDTVIAPGRLSAIRDARILAEATRLATEYPQAI